MKTTLEQLDRKYEAILKNREEVSKEIGELRDKLDRLNAAETTAAETGDVEKYKEIKKERSDTEDAIFVKTKTEEKYNGTWLDAEEVIAAWSDYAKGYNKELAYRLGEIARIRKTLRKEYESIINIQANALNARERCVQYLGGNRSVDSFLMDFAPTDGTKTANVSVKMVIEGLQKNVPLRQTSAELVYMIMSEEWKFDDFDRAINILVQHKDTKTPF